MYSFDEKIAAIHRIRVNIKSLTEEARIIRRETQRCGKEYKDMLHLHRTGRLREEARYALLTLAFLRGRKYKEVEQKCKVQPDDKRLGEKASRYISGNVRREVFEWLNQ